MKLNRNSVVTRVRQSLGLGLVMASLLGAQTSLADTKVVGYIPAYKNVVAITDATDLSKLTHINLSFLNPNAAGVFANGSTPTCMSGLSAADIGYVVQKAHNAGVKVLASLGGGVIPACSGDWQNLLANSRALVVSRLADFVAQHNLDGIDVDIEGALLTSIDNNGHYTPFIQALRNALPANKLVTAATATYVGGMVPTSSLPYFDFVTLMSYDAIGPSWGTPGVEHSTYQQAVSHIQTWQSRGLTKDKLVLGVPFYGYGFGSYASDYSFADIVNQFGAGAAQGDVIGTACAGCSYITYNGIPTIKSKTELALAQGSGVMIWEMSHDAQGSNSLLSAIHDVIGGSPTDPTDPVQCPAWVAGQYYVAGDLVSFEGGYYVAEYDNPGYTPTISTYFWEPVPASRCESSTPGTDPVVIQAEAYSNMSGVQLENTTDTGAGQNVGWIDAGDWMAYANVSFPVSGDYKVEYRVASINGSQLSLDLNAGAIQLGQRSIPATGGWQQWTTVAHTVHVNAGTYSLGVFAQQGGWNLNWIRITRL